MKGIDVRIVHRYVTAAVTGFVLAATVTGASGLAAAAAATPSLPGARAASPTVAAPPSRRPRTQTIHGHGKVFDLRELPPFVQQPAANTPEREEPAPKFRRLPTSLAAPESSGTVKIADASVPAPAPTSNFDGLRLTSDCNGSQCGSGHPPDTNGDVGPTYYIEAINAAIGIYDKASGTRVAAVTFNQFMSQGSFGNLCDTNNFGDPVVLYDSFEDRWFITDFAFQLDGGGNVMNPPGALQCLAVSKTGDPVAGGWNFYSINTAGGLGDYPKFGIWPDGIYMSTNMFDYSASGGFQNARVYAFDKAQMYAGAPSVQIVNFNAPSADFTLLPSNARLQAGTPPPGTPNYFVSTWQFTNALTVYKFHVDWSHLGLSTFTGPDTPVASSSWPNAGVSFAPTPGNSNDVLQIRAMMQNQYSNIGGVESLWDTHTVRRANTTGNAAPRFYQANVTGGTVAPALVQAATWDPEGANIYSRYMPSVAVDRLGDMALGYSLSNSTTNPSIRYAGRLASDPVNTFSQTEQVLIDGTGAQTGSCGGTCTRWGDYSAMTLDPDGCTFWYTNEYYAANGLDHHTRIGSFSYPSCTTVGAGGAVSGTVTATGTGARIAGASVALGSRTTTTAPDGTYAFAVPAGTYPKLIVTASGFTSGSAASVTVSDGAPTTQDFSLIPAASSGNFVDTTQLDFQSGAPTNVDLTSSPDDVLLAAPLNTDVQNKTVTNSGFGFNSTSWAGQTFKATSSGQLTRVDLDLFCSGCTGTTPDIIVAIRATTGSPAGPTGADLATGTIPGFSSGAGGYFPATFASPPTLTAGTTYAVVFRGVSNTSAGIYAYVCSCGSLSSNPYADGQRVTSTNSGSTWAPDISSGGRDLGFVTYVKAGFSPLGTLVSSVKDANPGPGQTPDWGAISWTASTPAGAGVTFQAAASNTPFGSFSFVGPDGTAGTTFSNGDPLAQFDGSRYLKYKATLTTSDGTATPTLHDVTIGFQDLAVTSVAVDPATGSYADTVALSATLTSGGNPLPGKSVSFSLQGTPVGSATTDPAGVASLAGVSLAGIDAGTYPGAVGASFAGDGDSVSSAGSSSLTVDPADQTITFAPIPGQTWGDPDFTVAPTASSGLEVTIAAGASDQCTVSGNTVHLAGAGSCTITASQGGDVNHTPAPDVAETFAIAKADQSITFGTISDHTFGDADFTIGATADSGLAVTFSVSPSGTCSVSGTTLHIAGGGDCTVTASQGGDGNYNPASDVNRTFNVNHADQAITFDPLPDRHFGDAEFTVSATASSGLAVGLTTAGHCTNTGSTIHLGTAGTCTVTASQAGDGNYNPAGDVARSFDVVAAATTTGVTLGAASVQYSDVVHLSAAVASTAGAPAGSVRFSFNGKSVGLVPLTGPAADLDVAINAPASATGYPVTAEFISSNPDFGGSTSPVSMLAVTREDARATYTGDLIVFAPTSSATSAQVVLSAAVKDITAVPGDPAYDASPGKISRAKVSFVARRVGGGNASCIGVAVVPLPSDKTVGTATCTLPLRFFGTGSQWRVNVRVGGAFYDEPSTPVDALVEVAPVLADRNLVGGGFLVEANPAGSVSADLGSRADFAYNLRYSAGLSNLRGSYAVVVRSGGHAYLVAGSSFSAAQVASPTASFTATGTAVITDLSTDTVVDASASLVVAMTSAAPDSTIGITVRTNTGSLWFSSNWNGSDTDEQVLGGGSLHVR